MKRGPCETHSVNGPCPDCGMTTTARISRAVANAATFEGALRAIRGPADNGPWIAVYQDAGGGYQGLQAIAEAALAAVEQSQSGDSR